MVGRVPPPRTPQRHDPRSTAPSRKAGHTQATSAAPRALATGTSVRGSELRSMLSSPPRRPAVWRRTRLRLLASCAVAAHLVRAAHVALLRSQSGGPGSVVRAQAQAGQESGPGVDRCVRSASARAVSLGHDVRSGRSVRHGVRATAERRMPGSACLLPLSSVGIDPHLALRGQDYRFRTDQGCERAKIVAGRQRNELPPCRI
jgi:hypothetical protein